MELAVMNNVMEKKEDILDYYKIVLVGTSGKGKTYSARNLNPESTGFINIENKPLPFKTKFKYHERPKTYTEAFNALVEYGKNPEINCIFLDSFTAYMDSVLFETRKTKKGFDIWSSYNNEIGILMNMIKRVPKHVFITAHYEILSIENGSEKRIKVKAKENEGQLENNFTVVLYADSKINPKDQKPEYWFNTYQEDASAKCPPDIFDNLLKVPNDCKYLLDKVNEFIK